MSIIHYGIFDPELMNMQPSDLMSFDPTIDDGNIKKCGIGMNIGKACPVNNFECQKLETQLLKVKENQWHACQAKHTNDINIKLRAQAVMKMPKVQSGIDKMNSETAALLAKTAALKAKNDKPFNFGFRGKLLIL